MLTFMPALPLTFRVRRYFKCNNICKRCFSDKVRVRFAPSPTGFLHLGGLRTALYNHLFAKSKNGVTILRIEDTDLSRKVPFATENLIKDLEWCGITYDEGPYFQSERKELYQKYVKHLLDSGDAYYCFCSNVRLELLRKEALKAREVPKYDNCCRHLPKDEIKQNLQSGVSHCIRFKLSNFSEEYNDLIWGPIKNNVVEVEGDPVIIKSDGFPTYHFANVVDDHTMNISHVLRGAEWQISTTKHLLLYRALKWEPPLYGHLPLLLNNDGTKISKRQGDAQINLLRNSGFLPNAVINFIIKCGGGFNIEQKEKDLKTFTFEELLERFDISKIKLSSCKVSLSDLNNYNQLEIIRLLETEDGSKNLIKATQDVVQKYLLDKGKGNQICSNENQIRRILQLMKTRIQKLDDLVSNNFNFLWVCENKWNDKDEESVEAIKKLIAEIETTEWNENNIKKLLKEFSKKNNLKFSAFMKTLRLILTGSMEGPTLAEIMELLGREDVQIRLTKSLGPSNAGE